MTSQLRGEQAGGTSAALANNTKRRGRALAAMLAVFAAAAVPAMAQLPVGGSTQFDITGFLQDARLAAGCAGPTCGGTLMVNGHVVVVPQNAIVKLPAAQLTWQELFAHAPAPYTGVATGMAMNDVPVPLTTYEVHVIGNRVADQYIAGLIDIAQNGLNSGAGYINFIDYALGEMRVGGKIGDATTGTRVRLNDPTGKYGIAHSPDVRFGVDPDNPTVAAGTGFPMCIPRGSATGDPLCPAFNRPGGPLFATLLNYPDPAKRLATDPDARLMAPMEVGDYVTFSGTLVTDNASAPTVGPLTATTTTYVSAHTVSSNVAIYTFPGTNPAYTTIEVSLIGTGGLTVLGAGEASIRTRFEGFTTDPSRIIHLYGMDFDATGAETDRDWGTVGVDQGPPTGAVRGRWRYRPPCTATSPTDKACTPPALGTYLPPTRELRAVIQGAWTPGQTLTAANGIIWGQYHAPINEYIFPENIPGTPVASNNFEAVPFLAAGGYTSSFGTLTGALNPWPGAVAAPAPAPSPGTTTDGVTINTTEYRTSKQRLIITATEFSLTGFDPTAVLTLQPYLTTSGLTFNPIAINCATFTNNGGGLYTLDCVGAPEPALPPATPLVVKSSLGGVSAPTALQRIRL